MQRRHTIGATAVLIAVCLVCTVPTSGADFTASEQGTVTISFEIPQKLDLPVTEVTPAEPMLVVEPTPTPVLAPIPAPTELTPTLTPTQDAGEVTPAEEIPQPEPVSTTPEEGVVTSEEVPE